ncbi:MAG TPA: MurR/RpiR family transcriptional regulator [Oligoflexus sp.]|uniref:MurR/RpiR family transcriptional regulator n=1 Tax=Oligoflexus sp. TaxID=1971216 RepID=UPI002D48846E|nr:MurR/RpiR family transcriptional regulator [Oligoflexus sp.]HYX36755.1 MurR/RpiR family transcriptional regulator [Oligoflexus sp.]
MNDNEDMFSRILEQYYPSMTPSEQRIADYLIQYPHESIRMSVAILAKVAKTSEATVVRFARSLGFKGFLEMKAELQRRASRELGIPQRHSQANPEEGKNLLCAIADQELANIDRTLAQLSVASLRAMSKSLCEAKVVYTLGSGASAMLAQMATYQLTLQGKRSIFLRQNFNSFENQLRLAQSPDDILWLFSFPPYSSTVIAAAQFASSLGLTCIAITDRSVSPLVPLVSTALYAANDNIFPSNSLTASLLLIRALVAEWDAFRLKSMKNNEDGTERDLIRFDEDGRDQAWS